MKLSGRSIVGFQAGTGSSEMVYAINPTNGDQLEPGFAAATSDEVERAAQLAHEAFPKYSQTSGRERAAFLRKIAANIEANSEEIIERGEQETALPKARL